MEKVRFECEVITPMFAGGADQTTAEIRGQTIKGLMRFWWRAYNAHRFRNITEMKRKEGEIFGSTDKNHEQKSSFKIKVTDTGKKLSRVSLPKFKMVRSKGRTFPIKILEYLCYGTYDYVKKQGNVFNRDYISVNSKFVIELNINDKKNYDDILNCFFMLTYFGGIGSKSRNGYGKFAINQSSLEKFPNLTTIINQLLKEVNANRIEKFPVFNPKTKLYKLKNSYSNWNDCLGNLGVLYKNGRTNLEGRLNYNNRLQYVAAPIIDRAEQHSILGRKSKQFFLNVIKENDRYFGYILYLHSERYCPESVNSRVNNNTYRQVCNKMNEYFANNMEAII